MTDDATGKLLIANALAWEIARRRFDKEEEEERLMPLVRLLPELTGDATVIETEHDGERGSIEIGVASFRDPDGKLSAHVAVFRDVTDRERVERAEREFITNAAH